MTPEQIAALAASRESETMELKRSTRTRREATRTVCAMLNQQGGHVLFGVAPDGRVLGQQVSDRTLEEVSAELRRIDPPAFPTLERVGVRPGFEVVAVTVSQGPSRPYRYGDAAWRRVGNTTLRMSPDEYNRMLFERMHSERRWENLPATGWSVDDLDLGRFGVQWRKRPGAAGWRSLRVGNPLICCADLDSCATESCSERRRCCSATGSDSNSRCRSVCSG